MCLEIVMARYGALFMLLIASFSSLATTLVTKNYVVSIACKLHGRRGYL